MSLTLPMNLIWNNSTVEQEQTPANVLLDELQDIQLPLFELNVAAYFELNCKFFIEVLARYHALCNFWRSFFTKRLLQKEELCRHWNFYIKLLKLSLHIKTIVIERRYLLIAAKSHICSTLPHFANKNKASRIQNQ